MDSENAFDQFSKAVNDGDSVQLDEIINYFRTTKKTKPLSSTRSRLVESILKDFLTRPMNNQEGETCVEVAVKKGYWTIVNELLKQFKFQVYQRIDFQIAPLSFLFQTKDRTFFRDICCIKIPITKLVVYLISIEDDDYIWLEFMLDSLMSSSITRGDKIIAMELIGASFIWMALRIVGNFRPERNKVTDFGFRRGIQCWKDSRILRDSTTGGQLAIPAIPCNLPERLRHVFGDNAVEMTLEALELLERQLILNDTTCGRSLQIQALVSSYKILSQSNHGQAMFRNLFYYQELLEYAFYCGYNNQPVRSFNISLFCLETFCDDVSNVLSSYKHFNIFLSSTFLIKRSLFRTQLTSANFVIVSKSVLKILANMHPQSLIKKGTTQETNLESDMWEIYQRLATFLAMLNQEDRKKLIDYFADYRADFKLVRGLTTFLRVLMTMSIWETLRLVIPILQFLLDAGVDPNETDENNETSLHILAKYSSMKRVSVMLKSLLNAGAHIDQATPNGETLGSILKEQRVEQLEFQLPQFFPFASFADDPLNVVLPLSCYCAQSIRRNRIRFENQLPPNLQEFVLSH